MKKRLLINLSIVIILVLAIIVSTVFANIKPNTSNVNKSQKIADFAKPAVVRILNYVSIDWSYVSTGNSNTDQILSIFFYSVNYNETYGSLGSGAIISSNGYIITNAHVVELSKSDNQILVDASAERLAQTLVQYIKDNYNTEVTYNQAHITLVNYARWSNVNKVIKVFLPGSQYAASQVPDSKTVFDGEIKSYGAPTGNGKDVAVIKVEAKNLPILKVGDSEKLQLQDKIWAIGFPVAADSSILSPDAFLVVSITDGTISALDKKSAQGAPVIQVNAATTHGSSGGPVVKDDSSIIGISTFRGDTVNGQEVQGFNFVVPSSTIKEFIAQAGSISNEFGDVDRLYQEGLELYWGGYYNDALLKFEAVQRLFPEQSEIKNLITDSQKNSAKSKTLWSKYKAAFYTFDILALISIILILVFTFRVRNKGRAKDNTLEIEEVSHPLLLHETKDQDSLKKTVIDKTTGKNIENEVDYELLKKYGVDIEELRDFNNDGKIDIEDVLIEIQQKNLEKTEGNNIQDQVDHDSKKQE